MAKTQSRKPAKAIKAAKAVKVATKKKTAKPKQISSYQPLKGISHVLVDFKDKILEEKIKQWGGTITKSVKTADSLVCEELSSDKAEHAYCTYNKHDYVILKEDMEIQLEEFEEEGEKSYPHLTIGKKSIEMRVDWFTPLGEPVGLGNCFDADASVSVVSNGGGEYYDCCYHDDGNISDMFSQLRRMQLLYDATSHQHTLVTCTTFLDSIARADGTKVTSQSRLSNEEDAIAAFETSFRDAVGFTWRNRLTCKPKKGSGLMVDLSTFGK